MIVLFVGDNNQSLADQALRYDPRACLITAAPTQPGTYYTSLADCQQLETFYHCCSAADEIFYDSSRLHGQELQYTELVLNFFAQTRPCHGLPKVSQWQWIDDSLNDHRRGDAPQMWAVGCSFTVGVGVRPEQSWKRLLSSKLNLPLSDLSAVGSSIIWQADQICRSDIRKDDVIFWGLTAPNRAPLVHNQQLVHLLPSQYQVNHSLINEFSPDILDHPSLMYHNILAVRRVSNFCRKVGARITMLGLIYDWDNTYRCYGVPEFRQYACWPMQHADIGDDGNHPGPQQHKIYAQEFERFYHEIYK